MSESDKILETLHETGKLIQNAYTNYKKSPKDRITRGYIEVRINSVEDYWTSFKGAHGKLILIVPRDTRKDIQYFKTNTYEVIEEMYMLYLGELKDKLCSLSVPISKETGSSAKKESSGSSEPLRPQVRLPKIQLPTFGGKYEAWPTFHDLFTSLIHSNTSITQVEKLHYLKSSVVGEAQNLLKNIAVTESNYESAWNKLKDRYGNRRITVNAIMKTLFTQKKVTTRSALSIRTLLDTTSECLESLTNLKVNIDSWDPTITYLVVDKLDSDSRKDWEEYSYKDSAEELPTWKELKKFLETKFRTLEQVPTPTSSTYTNKEKVVKERSYHATMQSKTQTEKVCSMCNENHTLSHCEQFQNLNPSQRCDFVKEKRLCFNCLLPGHPVYKCRIRVSCHVCKRRHHTLLHEPKETTADFSENKVQSAVTAHHVEAEVEERKNIASAVVASHHVNRQRETALLATALVKATNEQGHTVILRALIDQGSQACFITEKMAQALKLSRQSARGEITGVGSTKTVIKHVVNFNLKSIYENDEKFYIKAYVMPKELTTKIPQRAITAENWQHLEGLNLADPSYMLPGSIDLLLGVKEYAQMINTELIKGPPGSPIAQSTSLGWVIFGEVKMEKPDQSVVVLHHNVDVEDMLKTLWEVDTNDKRAMTKDEKICENIYNKTHMRNKEGRYIVKLPFKSENFKETENDTREIAIKRYIQLERRLKRQPNLEKEYIKVMQEYLELGHAEEVPKEEQRKKGAVYLPHHPVIRDDKDTTKTRVVFDASCKSSTGASLNDELLLGPILQEDIREIMMRWRLHAVSFVTDIKMMYRMILLHRDHVDFQRILWRKEHDKTPDLNNPNDVKDYRLLTVTFGTASAPYLAIKTLVQLTYDEGEKFPVAAKLIREDCYVDDLVSGCDSIEEAIAASKELKALTNKGGFELKKWSSNSLEFMKSIEPEDRSPKTHVEMKIDGVIKALGVVWNVGTDQLEYNIQLPPPGIVTKRTILSDIQKLYDPLGWITPSMVMAKMLIQRLWTLKVEWDEELNENTREEWLRLRSDLSNVNDIRLHRWLKTYSTQMNKVQIHGFCDASMRAYAAVAYIRVEHDDGSITTELLAAKSRVAPLKTLSLPRLELCGAVLLSRLLKQLVRAMRIPNSQVFAYTDSTIVLAWLAGEPARWKTFIANRVAEIVDSGYSKKWFHVSSDENPADVASRGKLLVDLKNDRLWWQGPEWLTGKEIKQEQIKYLETTLELKKEIQVNVITENKGTKGLAARFNEFDTLNELLTTIVYCKKFLKIKKKEPSITGKITTEDIEDALITCVKAAQEDEFGEEIKDLKNKEYVKKTSKIKTLNPYLDCRGLLKVGGRLKNAAIDEDRKHPIILGNTNRLAYLIVADAHAKTLHGGVQMMMCYLRSKYWIIKAKTLVKSKIHRCLICARHSATYKNQMMGNLPTMRVSPARPFTNSGVDLAGPFLLLSSKGRGMKTKKSYVCIFICMATRAIHIELVGDMTTEAFLGAFKRFTARRGRCSHLWSDQGRNFIGADKELKNALREACVEFDGDIAEKLAQDGTQWHFIPAYSPHFGGLWEAGVKSIKFHLKRVLTTNLTFEEMTTVLCEIEACLNSRPFCPIDEADTEELNVLTPGHFLIGEPPMVIPSPSLSDVRINTLSRWQFTQKLLRDFWSKWQQEYLTRLQQRPKWLKKQREFQVGDIVLMRSENMPPGKWPLARVVQKHPGEDNVTRVYSVKCGDSITKRNCTKLCFLPIECDD